MVLPGRRPAAPLLLAILLAASHGSATGDSYDPSMCLPSNYRCGSVNISYPFYLSNKTETLKGNPDSYCGYPGLAISCEDDKLTLKLNGGDNYTVTAINGTTLSLAYPDDLSCPRINHNYTIPLLQALSTSWSWLYLPTTVDYILVLFNCTFGIPRPTDIFQFTCQSSDASPEETLYLVRKSDAPAGTNLSELCRQVVQVPVLKDGKFGTGQLNSSSWGEVLRQGFQLSWEQSMEKSRLCNRCEKSGGNCGYNHTGEFSGCLCTDGRVNDEDCGREHGHKRTKTYIVATTSCLLLLCLLVLAFFLTGKYGFLPFKSKDGPTIESFLQKNGNLHPKRYSYADVKRMTNFFAVKLGQGGFGAVYRGNLCDGRQVAVKVLKESKGDGEEFMNEVASISRTSHVNVVMLLGFCLQGSKRALIYEYMPNGSLERYAFNSNFRCENTITWKKLFEIAIGVARGLEYLHRGCNTRIVHFDIKPHNILLDQDFCPKISDFGLSKLCLNKESAISIVGARGTIGYIAPEVYSKRFGTISSKSDVYSYGMMVLEMVGARDKNINADSESSSQYFPQWIYDNLDDYCISASEVNGETTELVRKMILVGLWCIQVVPTHRPTMTRVVEMLEGSRSNLELPPKAILT